MPPRSPPCLAPLDLVAARPFGQQADHRRRRTGRTRCWTRPAARPVAARTRSPPSACRSRCRGTAPAARARTAPPRSCPRRAALAEAARHQDAVHALQPARPRRAARTPGCPPSRAAPAPGWRCRHGSAPRPGSYSCRAGWCICRRRRSAPRPPARARCRRCAASGARSGVGLERQAEMPQHLAVHALLVIADRHRVDRVHVQRRDHRLRPHVAEIARSCAARRPGSAGRSGTAACAAGCRRSAAPSPSAASAWSSARRRDGMYGTSVRCTNIVRSGPSSLPSWRIASRNGRLSMSPTVPPISISAKSTSSVSRVIASLMRVGDVRDHLHRGAEIVAAPLLGDHLGIDAPGGGVVGLRARARR